MRTIPLLHPLDDTGRLPRPTHTTTDPESGRIGEAAAELAAAFAVPEPPATHLTRYHHPNFVRSEPHSFGAKFYFTGFTGREEEPEMPLEVWQDKTVTYEQRGQLSLQYSAARVMWSQARLRLKAAPVLRRAAPLWDAWMAKSTQLTEVFDAFWSTPDTLWRAQLLKLTDAEQAALAAAAVWDEIAEELAQLAAEQVRTAGEEYDLPLEQVAKEIGLDASDWHISYASDYQRGTYDWDWKTPAVRDLTARIVQQRERLEEVARLAGDSAAAQQLA